MPAHVVDTNVPVAANARSHAVPECVIACVDELLGVRANGLIVLDRLGLIVAEYMDHLSLSGEPGAGDAFMKWVWTVQADETLCEQVTLTPIAVNGSEDFLEFPTDPGLAAFDRSDRKFVAAALTSINNPTVINALDSDWSNHHIALVRNGVSIRYVCPHHVNVP
jgi:hypothetical protein